MVQEKRCVIVTTTKQNGPHVMVTDKTIEEIRAEFIDVVDPVESDLPFIKIHAVDLNSHRLERLQALLGLDCHVIQAVEALMESYATIYAGLP